MYLDYMLVYNSTFLFNDNFILENYYLTLLKNIPTASIDVENRIIELTQSMEGPLHLLFAIQ